MNPITPFFFSLLLYALQLHASSSYDHYMDENGMVMGLNKKRLPKDCHKISEDIALVIRVGRKYAKGQDIFGYDRPKVRVKPCSRLKVTLINEDQIRHQWMLHGLPRYLYKGGMFHLEVNGGHSISGTLIVPSHHQSYFVHCDMAQHTEKGLKGELIVGRGSKDIKGLNSGRAKDKKGEREKMIEVIKDRLLSFFFILIGALIPIFVLRGKERRIK